MDLLCSESVLTDSEHSLYKYKKATSKYNVNGSLSCCSASTIHSKKPNIALNTNDNLGCSANVSIEGNMSKLMYVFTSVEAAVCSTNKTKQLQLVKSGNYQHLDQQNPPTSKLILTPATNSAGANIQFKFVKAHFAVTDPIFITDRCLENALSCEEKQNIVDTYFKTVQKDITPPMRKIVAEWMIEVSSWL